MSNTTKKGDWDFSQNAQQMLNVSVAQIKSILNDGGDNVCELTASFIELAQTMNDLINHKTDIDHTDLQHIKHKIEQGIVAFQFYDRISQRLHHVSNSLQTMGNIIQDENKRLSPERWQAFQDQIQARFTMESERKLFLDIMNGYSVEEALNHSQESGKDSSPSIELF